MELSRTKLHREAAGKRGFSRRTCLGSSVYESTLRLFALMRGQEDVEELGIINWPAEDKFGVRPRTEVD